METRSVAIIGAGASGLCAARYLKAAGFAVTIFEIGTQIGGLWCCGNDNGLSSAYRTLHINTAKTLTNFSDFPFPADIQMFPDHRDMHAYLERFAGEFDLKPLIRFRTRVTAVRPLATRPGERAPWIIETEHGERMDFDAVVVASGHLSKPMHVERLRGFAGEYLHSHDYKAPERFVGQRVCIVGAGNSGCDIAADLATVTPATVLVSRSGIKIQPKLFLGRPFSDTTRLLGQRWIPDFARRAIIDLLIWLMHGSMTRLGFPPLRGRSHATSNPTIVQHIAYRRVTVKHDIERVDGKRIRFTDGTEQEFDTLIAATGYLLDFPFLPPDLVPIRDNGVALFNRMIPPDWPGLYFMGLLNLNGAANQAYERQAPWIVAVERGEAVLPSPAEMRAAIARKEEWVRRHYPRTPRHAIEEEPLPYFRELARSLDAARRRARAGTP